MKKFIYLLCLCFLVSCAGKNKKNEKIVPEKLYNRALEKFKKNDLTGAAEDFEKLESENPYTEYSNNSILMAAYAYYSVGDYDESLAMIDYIKRINFNELEYVYYLEILNKYEKVKKSRKDLALLKELYDDIEDMRSKFPNSIYEKDIIDKREFLVKYIVKNELEIVKHYINNSNLIGTLNHLREAVYNYPKNEYTPTILSAIYNLYKHIDYKYGVDLYYKVLNEKYKNTKWADPNKL